MKRVRRVRLPRFRRDFPEPALYSRIRKLFAAEPAARRPAPRARLNVEALEDRRVMSAVGSLPNAYWQTTESGRVLARSDIGTMVEVTQASGGGITASLFNASGTLIRAVGVAGTGTNDYEPTVAMANNGRFVVAWTDAYNGNYNDLDVRAQVFDANGSAVTGTIWVASTTHNENSPSVGMDYYGNFAVAYTYAYSPTDHDIYVALYNSAGGYQRSVGVATSTRDEYAASLDMNAPGRFVVAYTYDYSSTDQDVYASLFATGGNFMNNTLIAGTTQVEDDPSAAIDMYGNYAVAYTSGNATTQVLVQRVNGGGALLGLPLAVGWSGNSEYQQSLDMAADGRFVVSYVYQYSSADSDVYAQEFSASGTPATGSFGVATSTNAEMQPSVAMDSAGDYAISYGWIGTYGSLNQSATIYTF
jgi:hypothetical protein